MLLTEYLGVAEPVLEQYVENKLIDVHYHDEFPLGMLTYNRKAVYEDVWDGVTNKCRGVIFNLNTLEIVSRPFEKFFNYGALQDRDPKCLERAPDQIVEKMDGFLCTLYRYNGKEYIASRASFHSTHAKWATAWYNEHCKNAKWPEGYTPVFEGITPNIRIVVDYGETEGLFLTALVNNETGEELPREKIVSYAYLNGLHLPTNYKADWQQLVTDSFKFNKTNFEGYIFVWNRPGMTPFRVKVKYVDYVRLHRLVSTTTPKRIFEALAGQGWPGELNMMLTEGTPWFYGYVAKWKTVIEKKYEALDYISKTIFDQAKQSALLDAQNGIIWTRKQWAEYFQYRDLPEVTPILFGLLDGKDVKPIIWKVAKPVIKYGKPMIDVTRL